MHRLRIISWTGVFAWTACAICAAWALMRILGLANGFPLEPMIAFTPLMIPVAMGATAFAAIVRHWGAAGLGAIASIVLLAVVAPRAFGGGWEPEGATGPELRVLSMNTRLGHADPQAVMDLVRETDADVLCAQELTTNLAGELERAGLREILPESVVGAGQSADGSALYTRFPVQPLAGIRAPGYPFVMPRALIEVPGGGQIDVSSVHTVAPTGSSAAETWEQGLDALPRASETTAPALLIGDFNATLDHSELTDVIDSGYVDAGDATGGGLSPTWPSNFHRPPVTIDHVLADESFAITDYDVHGLPGSDHNAISAVLRLPGG